MKTAKFYNLTLFNTYMFNPFLMAKNHVSYAVNHAVCVPTAPRPLLNEKRSY
jgi:hypothetical protein